MLLQVQSYKVEYAALCFADFGDELSRRLTATLCRH